MVAIDDLLCVWEERLERGDPISPEELCQQCPELLGEVRWHIRALQAVESYFGTTQAIHSPDTCQATPRAGQDPPKAVRISTEYQIERLHASGGLGQVFLATDPVLNRRVAIKFPKWHLLSNEQRARFEREARVTSRLDHPGIVPVHSLKLDDPSLPCYVMRFVDGPTLHQTIQELHQVAGPSRDRNFYNALEFRHLLQNFVSLNNIVAYAHGQGVIHRDIKPGNVVLGKFGETLLLDWGLAKVLGERDEGPGGPAPLPQNAAPLETLHGQVLGTPAFSSPEQLLGQTDRVDQRSDIYSLGVLLYFLLTGKYPIQSGSLREQIEGVIQGKPIPPRAVFSAIPPELQAICQRAMARDPHARYPNVTDLTNDLERYMSGEAVSVLADPIHRRVSRELRRRPGLFAAGLATTVVAILAGWIGSALLNQKNRELTHSNERLETVVGESQKANQQALRALRSLVDEVVIRDLSENKILSGAEREFLQRIFEQYSALAKLQGESWESRAIRAEGLMQMGKIQMRLSAEQEALPNLETAVDQFQRLVDESGKFEHRLQLAETLAELGDVYLLLGKLDQASERVTVGIRLLEAEPPTPEERQRSEWVQAGLFRALGNVQQAQRQWKNSRQTLTEASHRLETIIQRSPTPSSSQLQALAAVYRHLGETSSQLGEFSQQVFYSEKSLDLQRQLVSQFPDQPDLELGLALACINCSRHRETAGQITAAVNELSEALAVAERLANRFPLVARYRETLAGLRSRRGNLEWKQDRPEQAETDLKESITLYRHLIRDFPEVPQYHEGLMRTELSLGQINFERSRVPAAERVFASVFSDGKQFQAIFPSVAARSLTPIMAEAEFALVRRRQGRAGDSIQPLEQAIVRCIELGQSDESATPRWWQARLLLELGCSQRALGLAQPTLGNLNKAADIFAELADRHSGDFDLLSRLATLHYRMALEYEALQCEPEADFHRRREIALRVAVLAGSPDHSYYQVLYARSLMVQGEHFRGLRKLNDAKPLYARAAEVISDALSKLPDDRLVRNTMGDLRAIEGRMLHDRKKFDAAEAKFAEAVELHPSDQIHAFRAYNLSLVDPAQVLTIADTVLVKRHVDKDCLGNLFAACGNAATVSADRKLQADLGDRMVKMLQQMVDDGYLPYPRTIRSLQTKDRYAIFRQRTDFNQLVQTLHELDRVQRSPAWIRAWPEAFQPALHWLSRRTLSDISLAKWLEQALQAYLSEPR